MRTKSRTSHEDARRRLAMSMSGGNEVYAQRLRRLKLFEVALRGADAVDEVAPLACRNRIFNAAKAA